MLCMILRKMEGCNFLWTSPHVHFLAQSRLTSCVDTIDSEARFLDLLASICRRMTGEGIETPNFVAPVDDVIQAASQALFKRFICGMRIFGVRSGAPGDRGRIKRTLSCCCGVVPSFRKHLTPATG